MVLLPCGKCCTCGPPPMPQGIEVTLEQVAPAGDLYFWWRVPGDAVNPYNPGVAAAYYVPPIAGTYELTEIPVPPEWAGIMEPEWYYASTLDAWRSGRSTPAERIEIFPDRAGRSFLPEFRLTGQRRYSTVTITERRVFMAPAYGVDFANPQPPTQAQMAGADWLATVQGLEHFAGIGQVGRTWGNGGVVTLQESCPGEFWWSDASNRSRRHQRSGNSLYSDPPYWQNCALPFKVNYSILDSLIVGRLPDAHNFPAGTLTTSGSAPWVTLAVNLRVEFRITAITYVYADREESMFPPLDGVVCDG